MAWNIILLLSLIIMVFLLVANLAFPAGIELYKPKSIPTETSEPIVPWWVARIQNSTPLLLTISVLGIAVSLLVQYNR